ncbi:hypothetical protein HPB50_022731 [Hyalomma asiaticum]|uniref:Uncharacterized protein n=1 Tax=Hyalomma asiaticum TaxID=266040 RepID=A0ACB7T947_HYAAI|nr:hypothetical protein HPB50_022731 [Hyalomma asiaticum]
MHPRPRIGASSPEHQRVAPNELTPVHQRSSRRLYEMHNALKPAQTPGLNDACQHRLTAFHLTWCTKPSEGVTLPGRIQGGLKRAALLELGRKEEKKKARACVLVSEVAGDDCATRSSGNF